MRKVIGIDLGTTKSCVSVCEGNDVVVIRNSAGNYTTPSVVAFFQNGEPKVGEAAKNQAILNPENTIGNIKRFMGKKWDDFNNSMSNNNYKIVMREDRTLCIEVLGKLYTPQEISAIILRKMKQTAEQYLGCEVSEAVITVPAYFNDGQRQATKEAGEIAGLKILRIINEPTAAALAYGLKRKHDHTVAVFDLGGGTFDISILQLGDGVFEVRSINGDTHLGGNDFDKVIMDWIADEFKKEEGLDLLKHPPAWQRIKESAEKAKIELTSSSEVEINIPYIIKSNGKNKHFSKTLSRSVFEKLSDPIFETCIELCKRALEDAELKTTDIDEVIMVGESCRIPKMLDRVETFFSKKPGFRVNLLEAVAIGAAIQGAMLTGEVRDTLLLDVTPLSLGIETLGGVMTKLIEANTIIPTKKSETFSTASDRQPSVEIHVLQGKRPLAKDNRTIGRFHLDGIPPAPKGIPQIEVTFDIDANGILHVGAKDKGTGKEQKIRIEGSSTLSREEIEKLKLKYYNL